MIVENFCTGSEFTNMKEDLGANNEIISKQLKDLPRKLEGRAQLSGIAQQD